MIQAAVNQWNYLNTALSALAPYDEEANQLLGLYNATVSGRSLEEQNAYLETVDKAIETYKAGKSVIENLRNSLLK